MSENPIPSKSLSSDGSDESKLIDGSTDFDWVEKHLLSRWRVVSRQEDYRRFCNKYSPQCFIHPTGDDQAIFDWTLADDDARAESDALREKYGLDQLWHYLTKFSEDIIDSSVFQNDFFAVDPVYRDSGDAGTTHLVENGWITVRIRITPEVTQKQWEGELKDFIAEAREEAGITPLIKKEGAHPTAEDFEIYDLYQSSNKSESNKSEIAATIWPEEYDKIKNRLTAKELEKRFHRLSEKYRFSEKYCSEENSDWDTKAHEEVYGPIDEKNKNVTTSALVQRVNDALGRVNKAMGRYLPR